MLVSEVAAAGEGLWLPLGWTLIKASHRREYTAALRSSPNRLSLSDPSQFGPNQGLRGTRTTGVSLPW